MAVVTGRRRQQPQYSDRVTIQWRIVRNLRRETGCARPFFLIQSADFQSCRIAVGRNRVYNFVPVLTSFFAPDFFSTATAALEIGALNQKERPNAPRPTSQIPGYATASLLCRFTEAVVDAFLSL